ncbi:hypothetical protein [Paractinoplanes brasiliensis]|uniref:Uncharacterized protein n=1 Tax=Paractinoplanes brasiliensis TaxID=52695 RepID=A0A4R6JNY2_9ACTN|nr:hypothetical protein [Actinoplanes brasiliensis]TDO37472.1 hypothetical protein C8E87_1100 [Actinoplanes brasiliensis]GID29209.1 hypothetical protein Abr02nite_41920 [Actinoplanes brasiliensis]
MILAIAVTAALLAGFLTGLLCFKKTNQFCGRCGVTRVCPICPPPAPQPARKTSGSRIMAVRSGVLPAQRTIGVSGGAG